MKPKLSRLILVFTCVLSALCVPIASATSLMENLGRGLVAVRTSETDVYVSWRLLGTDPANLEFNVYRSTGGAAGVKLNTSPLSGATIFTDSSADLSQTNAYYVRAISGGTEQAPSGSFTMAANAPVQNYLRVPLQRPAGGTTPTGGTYTYSPSDSSAGDLDGDGEYELIVKWDPSNAQDNSNDGYTGNVLIDGYKLDGTLLWRIDLGRNIRAGAHYTQFLVFDFDGDGKAELVCKTAPNTKGGDGQYIGATGKFQGTPSAAIDHNADYRNSGGYILTGPEFFTVFNGETGAELATTNYDVPRGNVNDWGDDYGNRVDRFLACVAYLDGQRPSFVLARGYYTRAYLAAWDFRGGMLTKRWIADTGHSGSTSPIVSWRGQGSHNLSVGDVDGDGRDEITYGAAAFDHDGTGLYNTLLGHGDALHMSKMDPNRPGLQVWMAHEDPGSYGAYGLDYRDAKTGQVLFGNAGNGADVGRGAAGDIDPRHLGYEMWGSRGGLMNVSGTQISTARPGQMNFMLWWDGDLLRELLDGTTVSKWDWNTSTSSAILAPTGVGSNNSTKSTPNLSADILGDWREEVIWRETTNDALRIYTTTIPTTHRLPTLMHDRQYRLAIAWQNVAYNQPPHPGFYLGEGMTGLPAHDIVTSLASLPAVTPAVSSINRYDPFAGSTGATQIVYRVSFNVPVSGVDTTDFTVTSTGTVVGTVSNVTALGASEYNVTVGSITGSGTIRLDLKASGTGITGPGGIAIGSGFTSGFTYNRATLAWTNATTGGLWTNAANWDGGVIANAVGAVPIFGNFDLTANNTITLDAAQTVSGLTFGDTVTASAASWAIDDSGNTATTLTLDTTSGAPVVTVNALGTDATATLATSLVGNDGLNKSGAGTLVLTRPASLTGPTTVTNGTLRIDSGGSLAIGSSTFDIHTTNGSTLLVNGGSFTMGGLATIGSGTGSGNRAGVFRIDAGTATFNGGIRTNAESGSIIRVAGGTFTATDVSVRRNSGSSASFSSGFIVSGGTANIGTAWIGSNNSFGAMSVEGTGTVNATGAITVANQSSGGRGGALRVIDQGTLTSTDTTWGLVLSRKNGTNANNVATAVFSGGVSTFEKITLGYDANVNAGSATITLNGGTVYLGTGGIVKNGVTGFTTTINLTSGVLGAKADWSTTHPMIVGGSVALKAANAAEQSFNMTLSGVLSGTGSITKSGGGTVTLDGATHTYAGTTTIDGGIFKVLSGLSVSDAAITINPGGVLSGNSALNRPVLLNSSGAISPESSNVYGTLTMPVLVWNGGGDLGISLGANGVSDQVAVIGALTKGTPGGFNIVFTTGEGFAVGNTYTIATFESTDLTLNDITATGLPAGTGALFTLNSTSLQVRIQGLPTFTSANEASTVIGSAFSFTATATQTPLAFSATGLPIGLEITPTGVISGNPMATGTFNVNIAATNTAGTTVSPLTLTIAKSSTGPTITLSNLTRMYDGTPRPVSATSSPAGYPITVTYNGSTTPPTLPGSYEVAARIEHAVYSATATGTLVISKATQKIKYQNTAQEVRPKDSIIFGLTTDSGLPLTYTVVSGPGVLNGNRLTFTGTGTVTVRASQPGNGTYDAAADVILTFYVTSLKQIYFGKIGTDDFAAVVDLTSRQGTLIARLGSTGEALIAAFDVQPDGTFSSLCRRVLPASDADEDGARQAAIADLTFTGTVRNGTLTASIPELGASLSADAEQPTGSTAAYSGLYTAPVLGTAAGETYIIAGANGTAFALVVNSNQVAAGTGTVSSEGAISVAGSGSSAVSGSVNAATSALTGTVTLGTTTSNFAGLAAAVVRTDRLVNLSSRLRVTGGDVARTVIAGFVVAGSEPKQYLIRAVGPTLSSYGVASTLSNPQLRLYNAANETIASNSGWNNDAAISAATNTAGAFKLTAGSADAALLVTLPAGSYTAHVGSNNSGIVLVEVYDLAANAAAPTKQLLNISTRGHAGTGDDVVVAGFVVAGNKPKRVLVRAIGAALAGYGVTGTLTDPVLTVRDSTQTIIGKNDNWGTPQPVDSKQTAATATDVIAAATATGAFPLTSGSKDAAVVLTLNPGAYTAIAAGANGETGIALVEVYELD